MSDIEQEIQAKGLTAPRVTPRRIQDVIASEHYFTAADAASRPVVNGDMVSRFLTWPVPADVYPDGVPGKDGRTGTNLMTAQQTRQMLDHVVQSGDDVPAPLLLLTFCVLVLKNGFTVTGESACASPENFDAELGRTIARDNAINKVWMLEGYLLKQQLHEQQKPIDCVPIAKKCHEINRAYCAALGDTSQLPWDQAPEWQRQSAINGVQFHVEHQDAGPDASHNSWLEEKRRDGWKFGPVKDADKKEHPCFVPYDQLPSEQKAKDYLFKGVVDQELGRA